MLEGYKVADAIAKHGAGGSSFSDWWAYKFEVYDAIPYNGALLHNAGVVVSFNSDNAELARRLNLEAAKAVKYGGVPPEEALKFVTLNPARQLGIDDARRLARAGQGRRPGRVERLAACRRYSRCEQTWVDGRRYFDLEEDRQARRPGRRAARPSSCSACWPRAKPAKSRATRQRDKLAARRHLLRTRRSRTPRH